MNDFPLLEEALERDIRILREHLRKMAGLVLKQLEDAVLAFTQRNRSLGYTVVLRDHRIDLLEDRIDRLSQEFLVRHMPVSEQLRFVVALAKVNSELERIGDYAEAIARRAVKLCEAEEVPERDQILEMSRVAFQMLSQAIESFLGNDSEAALKTLDADRQVDRMNSDIFEALARPENGEALAPPRNHKADLLVRFTLVGLINRIERVADRACNIAEETVYVARGDVLRHFPRSDTRVLFLDETNACRSLMAEAIARQVAPVHFSFASAGMKPASVDCRAVDFLQRQGIDASRLKPKELAQAGKLEDFNVVVTLSDRETFPPVPYQVVQLRWDVADPSVASGSPEAVEAAYLAAFDRLVGKIKDLTQGLLGAALDEEES